jgi:hypothetical protein
MATNMQIDTPPAQSNQVIRTPQQTSSPVAQALAAQTQSAQSTTPPVGPPSAQSIAGVGLSSEEMKLVQVLRDKGFNSMNNFGRMLGTMSTYQEAYESANKKFLDDYVKELEIPEQEATKIRAKLLNPENKGDLETAKKLYEKISKARMPPADAPIVKVASAMSKNVDVASNDLLAPPLKQRKLNDDVRPMEIAASLPASSFNTAPPPDMIRDIMAVVTDLRAEIGSLESAKAEISKIGVGEQ